MENVLIGLALNKNVRIYIADTTEVVEDARKAHDLYPTSAAALGRVIGAGGLMGLMLKDEGKLHITINGSGSIGTIMVSSNNKGEVKGFVSDNTIYLKRNSDGKLAVKEAVGTDGYLKVTKTGIKNNFTGSVKLVSGELGEDFAYYFMQSEQTPTIVSLGVLVNEDYSIKKSGALIIQLLPGHLESDIVYLENLLKEMKPITQLLSENKDLEKIVLTMFKDYEKQEYRSLKYYCDCNKERFMAGISTLPLTDILELKKENKIEVKCEYCNKLYEINKNDLEGIISYVENQRFGN